MENKDEIKKDHEKLEDEEILDEAQDDSESFKGLREDNQQNDNEEQLKDLNNRLLRLQADFINYKSRVEREKKSLYSSATEDIINQLLPVVDNFERALENMANENSYYEGVKMIYDQMIDVLTKNGLKEIKCEGEYFDPNFHHAVFMEESEDKDEGTILEVLQKGYMLNEKIIRPSMVKVAK